MKVSPISAAVPINTHKGWECPKCARNISPAIATCPYCQGKREGNFEETKFGTIVESDIRDLLTEGS